MSIDDDYFEVRQVLEETKSPALENFERLSAYYRDLETWEMEWKQIINALGTLRRFLVGPPKPEKG